MPSHYNFSTPLDAALMGGSAAAGTAAVFIAGVGVLLVAAARARHASTSLRLGVLSGAGVLLTGCLVGLVMISSNSGVYQGRIGAGFADQRAAYRWDRMQPPSGSSTCC